MLFGATDCRASGRFVAAAGADRPSSGSWRRVVAAIAYMGYMRSMNRDEVIRCLRAHEAELRRLGIVQLSLFGSVARGEAGPESDVDLAAQFDRNRPFGMFQFVDLQQRLGDLLGVKVDLVGEPIAKPRFRARVDQDRVRVF